MNIMACSDSQREAWNSFVAGAPDGSVYHRFEWRDINESALGHRSCYLAATDNERIVGIFPLVQVRSRLFGNIACSLPFVNFGGPCAESREIEHDLLAEGARVVDRWRAEYLEIRSRKHLGPQYPTSEHKISVTVPLADGADAVWHRFKTAHRQDIRHGYKQGFTAAFGGVELLDDLYEVLSEAWRNFGTPIYSRRYFETVARTFADSARLCVVYGPGGPVAASFQIYEGDTAEGLWLGSRARGTQGYAGYVLYWELLKDAAEHGCKAFHLGRSTAHSGAEAFKLKWNATAAPLYWQYILRRRREIPSLNTANSRYAAAIAAWRRLPVWVTTKVGPMLARSIP